MFVFLLQLLILSGLGRAEEAVDQLKAIVHHDAPDHFARNGELFEEVVSIEILNNDVDTLVMSCIGSSHF